MNNQLDMFQNEIDDFNNMLSAIANIYVRTWVLENDKQIEEAYENHIRIRDEMLERSLELCAEE